MVTVDCDTRGLEVAQRWIDAANPTHPSLIDTRYLVAELYNTRNIPAAFWIDEAGAIVRANDPIFAQRRNRETGETTTNVRYLDALRDWVAKGPASIYVTSAEDRKRQIGEPDEANAQATVHFRLGSYLHHQGHAAAALAQFKRAHELKPDNWNFKRQAWSLGDIQRDYGTTLEKALEKARRSPIPYRPPLELPYPQ